MKRTTIKRSKVVNGNVTLRVSEAGQGQTLLFLNGQGVTQRAWERVIGALNGQYRIVTCDFRNHGFASRTPDVSFEGFMSDVEAIMDRFAGSRPIVVGWSLGADLAVWYAAAHAGKVAGLFLIDGALPVNLVSDPADVRRRLNTPAIWISPWIMYLFGMGYRLTPDQMADITFWVNKSREQILTRYSQLDCPVELVLATRSSRQVGERGEQQNALWRSGGEQLARLHPAFTQHWLDNTHLLPFNEPTRLAESLDAFALRIQANESRETQEVARERMS